MPFKFIHITDTHLANPGLKLYGLDPRARLDAAVANINKHQSDAAFAVVTGDLTHWGEPESYVNFAEAMGALKIPYIAMVGNHDKRVACLDGLKAAPRDPNGFVQGTRTTEHGLFVFLDTLDETSHAGEMCAKRLGWLASTLAAAPADMPFVVFMHHPPFPVGVHAMDEIALAQSAEFAEVIAPYRARTFAVGEAMYGHVGIPREDKATRRSWFARNFEFFGAPAALFCTVDRRMGPPQWSDLGMYLQNVMLLAVEAGLATCPQECWAMYPETVERFLGTPADRMLFCGMAIGYEDESEAANRLRTERAPEEEWLTLLD